MNHFIFVDEFGKASYIYCEACQFNFDEVTISDLLEHRPIIFNMTQLHESRWEKLREMNGYICPRCAKKDHLRELVKSGETIENIRLYLCA